jgi:general secretion pathway protein C
VKDQLARLVRQLDAKAMDRLALVASVVLVVLLAHSLARLTWIAVPAAGEPAPPASTAPTGQKRADYRQIAALHLFGQAEQAARSNAPIDAPETRLNLTLRGILFNTDPQQTRAIISAPGKEDDTYRVGSQVPGGAVIDQIYADRVMLLRNGQYETLRLPEQSVGARSAAPGPSPAGEPAMQQPTGALSQVRRDLMDNPQNVAAYIQAEPVNRSGGGMIGFRVRPGPEPEAFQLSGLQEGDIITAVNGVQLDSPDKAADALLQLSSSDTVNVSVLRQGAEFTLQIQLGSGTEQ